MVSQQGFKTLVDGPIPDVIAARQVWIRSPSRPGAGDSELDDGVAAAAVGVHLNCGSSAGSGC